MNLNLGEFSVSIDPWTAPTSDAILGATLSDGWQYFREVLGGGE